MNGGLFRQFLHCACAVTAALISCVTAGCDNSGSKTDTPVPLYCSSGDTPYLLHSKIDDDDGDGNPLDEDFPAINDEDDDIADHAWIRDDTGRYHLFFHNEGHIFGSAIEHYISTDLEQLEYVGVALRPNPDGWDSYALWAPHVVRYENFYYMFYTGVDGIDPAARQRIGLATSTDLIEWTRHPANRCPGTAGAGCVYQCDESWTTWGKPDGEYNHQCRDPFVIRDPARKRWVMFATAKSTNQYGVITVSYSNDLESWTGAGFINATRRFDSGTGGQPTGGQAENPFVMSHGGIHYLLFTDWQDSEDTLTVVNPRTIVQYTTSSTLIADTLGSPRWIYRGYIPDPGVNAIEVQRITNEMWLMSQSIANKPSGLWEHRRELRLKCVIWEDNFSFATSNVSVPSDKSNSAVGPASSNIP